MELLPKLVSSTKHQPTVELTVLVLPPTQLLVTLDVVHLIASKLPGLPGPLVPLVVLELPTGPEPPPPLILVVELSVETLQPASLVQPVSIVTARVPTPQALLVIALQECEMLLGLSLPLNLVTVLIVLFLLELSTLKLLFVVHLKSMHAPSIVLNLGPLGDSVTVITTLKQEITL